MAPCSHCARCGAPPCAVRSELPPVAIAIAAERSPPQRLCEASVLSTGRCTTHGVLFARAVSFFFSGGLHMRKQMAASLAAHKRSRPGGRCQCLLGNASLRPPLPLSLRRLPSMYRAGCSACCACHRVAFFRSHSDQQQHSLSQNKHNTPTKTTPSQASCCVSFSAFFHRHNAHPLALGLLNFQWNAPVSTQLHLLHEEGARRTSLDQFTALQVLQV